jgi:hypothetical protein
MGEKSTLGWLIGLFRKNSDDGQSLKTQYLCLLIVIFILTTQYTPGEFVM